MSSRSRAALAILVLLISTVVGHDPDLPAPQAHVAVVESSAGKAVSKRGARHGFAYDSKEIEAKFSASRFSIAGCFLKDPRYPSSQAHVQIAWEGSGAFRGLSLEPRGDPELHQCLQAVIERWPLKPHPGLKPFVYDTTLVLD